jgi:hypothetical protein
LGKVDCAGEGRREVCMAAHVAAFPTIMLYKGGSTHSHTHYHGDRTVQDLLNFLVVAREDEGIVTNPHAQPNADPHADVERIARQLHMMGESLGNEHAGHNHESDHADVDGKIEGRDPADPGKAVELIEAIHKAGLHAPGDAARAALGKIFGAVEGGPSPAAGAANEPECAPGDAKNPAEQAGRALAATAPSTEGCMIAGEISVKRVPGHIKFAPGAGGMTLNAATLNMTHIVHDLYFGSSVTAYQLKRLPPNTDNELHRLRNHGFISLAANMSHEHYTSVVGSTFRFSTGHTVGTYRYTANSNSFEDARATAATAGGAALAGGALPQEDGSIQGIHDKSSLPSVRFSYEMSPMSILVSEYSKPTYQFITSMCAIVGGVFTVIGLLDSLLHSSLNTLKYKAGIGKQG